MKSLFRTILINSFSLFLLPYLLEGVKITGGIQTYFMAGFLLTILFLILKPILNIVALPLNFLSFGFFSSLINAIILYLMTLFINQVSISPFTFQGYSLSGFVIPKIYFNVFFAYLVSSFIFSFIVSFIKWIIEK